MRLDHEQRMAMRALAIVLAVATSGCGLLTVKGLDAGWQPERRRAPVCDVQATHTIRFDGIAALVLVGMAVFAATYTCEADDPDCGYDDATRVGATTGAFVASALFLTSALVTRNRIARCRAAQTDYQYQITR